MAHTVIAKQRTMHNDIEFFKDVISSENIREFNGYNTKLCRLSGLSVSPMNNAVYMPLIDMPHADPSTMMTALVEANRLTSEASQEFTILTYASGHVNYARYGLFYLRSMEKLPVEIRGRFMKGEHVMHHIPGLCNGIWTDMYIESTVMRYGHSNGGIIGLTLQPETLKIRALGLHIQSRVVEDMTNMSDQHSVQTQETHKEESKSKMQADAADRKVIQEKLEQCINPLAINSETDSQQLVNIVSGTNYIKCRQCS